MTDLAAELADLRWATTRSPWDGYERNVGYGVMNLPFSSGDMLALRVFPRTDFGGYVSIWHEDPVAGWAQYVDRAPVDAGCPRVWGPALHVAAPARIRLAWTAPMRLSVTMDEPALRWDLEFEQTLLLAVLNAAHGRAPLATWTVRPLIAVREWIARLLGLGATAMSGPVPSGEHLVAVLRRMFWVRSSSARLRGRDLGEPVTVPDCPTIGGWPLPRRGLLATGEAHVTIGDTDDYERLRRAAPAPRSVPPSGSVHATWRSSHASATGRSTRGGTTRP